MSKYKKNEDEIELRNIELRFKTYLPNFVLDAPYLREIFKNEMLESYYLGKYAQKILNELSISTVKKTIDKWETLGGLNNENLELSKRISSVINKFSSQIHANYYNFLSMLKTIDDKIELDEFINEYRVLIKTYMSMDYANLMNLINIIHSYKPAHIGFDLEIYRDIYKSVSTALILQNIKCNNLIVKAYSNNALINLYKSMVINKVNKIDIHIKGITGDIQNPFFCGVLINRVKKINVYIKGIIEGIQQPFFIGILVNRVKIREITFNTV